MAPQDPQIELQASDGTAKGIIYINASDELVFREATNGNEVVLQTDGSFKSLTTDALTNGVVDGNSWEGVNELLGRGAVVAEDGSVYFGSDALQRAINDANAGWTLWVGNSQDNYINGYDPIVMDGPPVRMTLIGMGSNSLIRGATSHALEVNNKNGAPTRNRFINLKFQTPSGGGNNVDAIHFDSTRSTSDIFEFWFDNCEIQESDRHAINMDGQSGAPITTIYFDQLFMEGIDQKGLNADQYAREVEINGGVLDNKSDTQLIDYDGSLGTFFINHLNKQSGVDPIRFGSNSVDCLLLCPDKARVTDNGNRNSYWTADEYFHEKSGVLTVAASPYGPQTVGANNGLLGGPTPNNKVHVDGGTSDHAIKITGERAYVSNIAVKTTGGSGNNLDAMNVTPTSAAAIAVSNVVILDSDRDGVRIGSNVEDSTFEGIAVEKTDGQAVRCDGTRVSISGALANEGLTFGSNSENCVFYGRARYLTDNGTRNVFNGQSKQSATPGSGNSGDEWNGWEGLAQTLGVVVEDTSVSPSDFYRSDGSNWVQIG